MINFRTTTDVYLLSSSVSVCVFECRSSGCGYRW